MGSTFGGRLAEERSRLKHNQVQMAELVGATKRSVIDWEKDLASPKADYLMRYAAVGVDVLYVLTGQRVVPTESSTRVLRPDQEALLDNYEHSDEIAKQAARRLLDPKSKRRAA